MNNNLTIGLINNAALLLSLGLIYDIFYRGTRTTFPLFNKIASGIVIGVIAIVLMATPVKWETGIIFDTRTILLGLTGLFFGTIPTILSAAMASAYRLNLGGVGTLTGVATIISASLIGLAWRHYRFRESREMLISELYLFGAVVHAAMILCMFLLPHDVFLRMIRTLAFPIVVIYPIFTSLLGSLLASRQRRFRIEQELKESTNRFSQLAQQSRTVTWEVDAAGLYTYVSPLAESVFGYQPEELVGRMHFYDFHPEEGRAAFKDAAIALIKKKSKFENLISPIQTKDDKTAWVSINGLPIFAKDGSLIGYRGSDTDITERKLAAEALQESEQRYKDLFDSTLDGIFHINSDGFFTRINQAGAKIFGYETPDEMIGLSALQYWKDPRNRNVYLEKLRIKKTLNTYPISVKRINGELRELEASSRIIEDSNGVFLGIEGTLRDVTERRHAEEEKERLQAQLLQAQKMESIGTLAGGIAHDFNNILTAIVGYGYLVHRKLDSGDPLRQNIESILSSADRAADLTRSLLAFSRKQPSIKKQVDLNDIVKKSESFLKRIISEDIEFIANLSSASVPVFADRNQVEQVLMNLSTNARDAMPKGGVLTITIDSVLLDDESSKQQGIEKPGFYGMITVSDTGIGMSEEIQKRMFEPFYTTKEVGKGTGLGLSIIYGIVKQHDGFITVDSKPGKGTNFKVYLPITDQVVNEGITTENPEVSTRGTETILLAEDEDTLRDLLRSVLAESGYEVIVAVDGEDAVGKFAENKNRIHLFLSDIVMPKKSGKEAYDEIIQLKPDIKALFLSGYSPEVILNKAPFRSESSIIYKPIYPIELLKKVRRVLDEL
jgi:two-component system, cell cycle sensor histidine kinase and response regulator CckA